MPKPPSADPLVKQSFALNESLANDVEAICRATRRTTSEGIRDALRWWLYMHRAIGTTNADGEPGAVDLMARNKTTGELVKLVIT